MLLVSVCSNQLIKIQSVFVFELQISNIKLYAAWLKPTSLYGISPDPSSSSVLHAYIVLESNYTTIISCLHKH